MMIDADRLRERVHRPGADWPPYALTSWDDRNRYRDWVLKMIGELEMLSPVEEYRRIAGLQRIQAEAYHEGCTDSGCDGQWPERKHGPRCPMFYHRLAGDALEGAKGGPNTFDDSSHPAAPTPKAAWLPDPDSEVQS